MMKGGVMVLLSPSPVCKGLMKGATAVLPATVLVNRLLIQLNSMLVRIQC